MITKARASKNMLKTWFAGFITGMVFLALLLSEFRAISFREAQPRKRVYMAAPPPPALPRQKVHPASITRPEPAVPEVDLDDIANLRKRNLGLPLKGLTREQLRDSFSDVRGGNRVHAAIDIIAPRNTEILAVEDGTIAKLWTSKYGGLTIYHFDPKEDYAYYYAHLEKYRNGLKEGEKIKRGDLIGFVGTSGNAPPNTPHLHFSIFKLTSEKRWWEGAPINPYLVYRNIPETTT